jgi:hypothetical protein
MSIDGRAAAAAWIRRVIAALGGALLLCALAAPAQARWIRVESPHFIVWSDGGEPRVREYVQQLEMFDWLLRYYHGVKADAGRKLDVYLVARHDELKQIEPGISDDIRGFYKATAGDIAAFAMAHDPRFEAVSGLEKFVEDPVFHEYVHHFMLNYFPYGYPGWLVEGYAVYFGSTTVKGSRIEYGKYSAQRYFVLTSDPWIPLSTLLTSEATKLPPNRLLQFYSEAGLLTHYFMETPERRKQLDAYTQAVGRGTPSLQAMQNATGMSIDQLDATLHTYMHGRFSYSAVERKAEPAALTVTELPESADDVLLDAEYGRLEGRLLADKSRRDPAIYLKSIRATAARLAGDRMAQIAQARAEIYAGDRKTGETILDQRLKDDPNNIEALDLAAEARIDDAYDEKDFKRAKALAQDAQPLIGRAFKLDATRYQTLWVFVQSRRFLDEPYPSDNTLDVLETCLDYAPQAAEIRLETAHVLMNRRKFREAVNALQPLANDPHHSGAVEQAQAMLKEIESEDKSAFDPAPAPAAAPAGHP